MALKVQQHQMLNRVFFFFTGLLPNANPFTFPLSAAFCPEKSPPSGYPSFSFFRRPHASLFVIHQDISGPQNLLQLFQTTPSLIPDSAPPLLKTPSPSHSQSDHAWMRHGCTTASPSPNRLAGALALAALAGPRPCLVLGQAQAYPGLKFSLKGTKTKNNVGLKSKTKAN